MTDAERLAIRLDSSIFYDDGQKAAALLRKLQAENEALRVDAERYRWVRNRLRVKLIGAVSGSVRDGMEVRMGCAFFDSPVPNTYPPTYPIEQAEKLDAAIDAAIIGEKA